MFSYLNASCTPLARLLLASCTPLARLLHACYTPLTRLYITIYVFSRASALAYLNGVCSRMLTYALYHCICVQPRVGAGVLERAGAGVEISRCSRELEKSSS
jgi:hypothetical protein